MLLSCRNLHVLTAVKRELFIWGTFATVRAEIPLLRHYHGLCYSS